MTGKLCLVCGGTSGIGLETCRGLAQMGARVVLTGTTADKARRVAESLPGDCTGHQLDFTRFSTVRRFADWFLNHHDHIDVLIHNAGLVRPKRVLTEDGLESTFAVTYLGPFLLTQLLHSRFGVRGATRIINVASDLHHRAKMDWDDLQCEKGYQFISAFAKAELAKILWTQELSRRYPVEVATANSLHPGGVKTQLFRHFRGPMKWLIFLSNQLKSSPQKGARTSLYLASSPEVEGVTGKYFIKCREQPVSKQAADPELATRLWDVSLGIAGVENSNVSSVEN